jgi:chitin disaccharide deacetylase
MRHIWLCADDYGISTAVNVAIRDLVVRGRLNAISVLVVAPSCYRAEALALAALNCTAPRVAIGLHVALTAPFRPSSPEFSPLREGAFVPLAATLTHALLRRFKDDALRAEVAHQLKDFSRLFGRLPDFIDGHQHVHLLPQIREAVLRVAKEAAPNAWLRQCGRAAPFIARFADRKGLFLDILSRGFRRRAAALGLRTNPAFAGTYAFAGGADFRALFASFLEGLPDGGVVMCHPGFVDAELARLDPLTTLREREYAFLAGDGFPALLAAHGVTLGSNAQSAAGSGT